MLRFYSLACWFDVAPWARGGKHLLHLSPRKPSRSRDRRICQIGMKMNRFRKIRFNNTDE